VHRHHEKAQPHSDSATPSTAIQVKRNFIESSGEELGTIARAADMEKIETPEGPSAIPLIGGGYCSPQHAAVYRRKCRHNRCKSLGDIVLSKLGGMLRAWFFS